jgi:hypothetical protein
MSKCFHGEATFGQLFSKDVQQEEKKMKRDEMKKKENIYRVWLRVSFDPTMWISLKINKIITTTLVPRVQIGLPS